MELSFKDLRELSPQLAGGQLLNTRSIITRFYCGKLRVNGICTGKCLTDCKPHLGAILFELEKAEKPGALLTWRSKNEAAKAVEQDREEDRQEPAKHQPVIFDQPAAPDNPFLGYLETLK